MQDLPYLCLKNNMEDRAKKLIYRSTHRGCKENDIIMQNAASFLQNANKSQLDAYEAFLEEYDVDIYNWFTNVHNCPAEYLDIITVILAYKKL